MHDPFATLELLLQQARDRRDEAVAALRRADAAARRARHQADDLAQYRGQYRDRWSGRFQQGAPAALLDCWHRFGGRLDQAIEQQNGMAAGAEGAAEAARGTLVRCEQRVALVQALIDRRRAEIARTQARRDQRDADESAQQLALNPSPQAAPAALT